MKGLQASALQAFFVNRRQIDAKAAPIPWIRQPDSEMLRPIAQLFYALLGISLWITQDVDLLDAAARQESCRQAGNFETSGTQAIKNAGKSGFVKKMRQNRKKALAAQSY